MAIVIALLIGVPAGVVSAVLKNAVWDYAANAFALWGIVERRISGSASC